MPRAGEPVDAEDPAPASGGGRRTWHRKELGGPLVRVGERALSGTPSLLCRKDSRLNLALMLPLRSSQWGVVGKLEDPASSPACSGVKKPPRPLSLPPRLQI